MALDLRDQVLDRLVPAAARDARSRAAGRAARASRARDKARPRPSGSTTSAATATARRRTRADAARRRRLAPHRRRRSAGANFDPRGFGFGLADPAGGTVARDLVELVAIDRDVAAGAHCRAPRPSGHSTAKIAAAVISANTNHKRHGGFTSCRPQCRNAVDQGRNRRFFRLLRPFARPWRRGRRPWRAGPHNRRRTAWRRT